MATDTLTLHGRRSSCPMKFSIEMIWRLHEKLGIPAESLIRPPAAAATG